jgi:diacylglycerol kinase (ATP)
MKHIFIINPMSGPSNQSKDIIQEINKLHFIDSDYYVTTAKKDATRYVKEYIMNHPDEETRFYACGGDGTINEVASGLVGSDKSLFSMSVYPVGSGNDYIKIFGGKEKFMDMKKLVEAKSRPVDVIEVNQGEAYSINVINFGFDCNVVATMEQIKRNKETTNEKAYKKAVFKCLFKDRHNLGRVKVGEEYLNEKEYLFCTIANGQYIGGQFKTAPRSVCDDGLLEVTMIKPVSVIKFLTLLGDYTAGRHLDSKKFKKILTYRQTKDIVTVTGPGKFCICLDGELQWGEKFVLKNLKHAVNFAVPE